MEIGSMKLFVVGLVLATIASLVDTIILYSQFHRKGMIHLEKGYCFNIHLFAMNVINVMLNFSGYSVIY